MERLEESILKKTMNQVVNESLIKAMSYEDYWAMMNELVLVKKTSGPLQTEALVTYTLLNFTRMKRLDKTLKFSDALVSKIKKIDKKITWLVLTESWCGDAAQTTPIMNKIASLNPNIEFKVVLRDENLELMNLFLTNGTLSIPKLITIDTVSKKVLSDWGPRPSAATKMVADYKRQHGALTDEFKQDLQVWYTKDKGQNTVDDLLASLLLE